MFLYYRVPVIALTKVFVDAHHPVGLLVCRAATNPIFYLQVHVILSTGHKLLFSLFLPCLRRHLCFKIPAAKVTHPGARAEKMLLLLYLLCCVPAVQTCLQCDHKIRRLHENFILSAPTISDQIELKKICDHAYATYKDTSQEREGIIGEPNLLVKQNMLNLGFCIDCISIMHNI